MISRDKLEAGQRCRLMPTRQPPIMQAVFSGHDSEFLRGGMDQGINSPRWPLGCSWAMWIITSAAQP